MPGTSVLLAKFLLAHAKFLVAIVAAVSVFLETMYPYARWEHAVTAGIGAFLVYLVPNAPRPAAGTPAAGKSLPPP